MNRLLSLIIMSLLLSLLLISPSGTAQSQDDTTAAPKYGWKHSVLAGLALTQASYTDWSAGGENALAYQATVDAQSVDDREKTNWTMNYKFSIGHSRLGNQGLRKTDDKIDLESVFTYKLTPPWGLYGAATFKSQFVRGYEYDDLGGKTGVSKFFDPGYLTQTAGISYEPAPVFKTRFGVGLRETFTSEYPVYADDPETPEIEKTLVQGILESVSDLTWTIDENIVFTSKLELLAPFDTFDRIVVRSDNALNAKISDLLTASLNLELINDWRVTRRTQVRQTMAFGISYSVL